jgi:hypothetical protein
MNNKWLLSACAALALAACDAVQRNELQPGASADAVRTQMGQPDSIFKESDGREIWEYPRGPEGTETLRLTIGPDNVLKEIRNVLTDEFFGQIQNGMNKEQVRRLVGRPGFVRKYGTKPGDVWEWKYMRDRNTPMVFQVDFTADGIVAGKGASDPAVSKPQ